ncbi:MAG TPA: RNA methyltransferase [Caulobacteraceae bacterium]
MVGRRGGFIAEGEVVLRVLARSRLHRARHVLIAQKRVDKLAPILGALGADVEVFAAAQPVLDTIAGFALHRGILAYGERGPEAEPGRLLADLDGTAPIVCLFGIANHDNLGGVFRNAAAFGAAAVLLDSRCCDPLYRKAIRVSVGAALSVPFVRLAPGEDILALLRRYDFAPLALSPGGATPLARLQPPKRCAVLLGSEGEGLSAAILSRAPTVSIPMAPGFDSLNVATASGIVLHHLVQEGA